MMVLDHTGKGTLIDTLPAYDEVMRNLQPPVECFDAVPKYVYDSVPLDDDMVELLMNAGALA